MFSAPPADANALCFLCRMNPDCGSMQVFILHIRIYYICSLLFLGRGQRCTTSTKFRITIGSWRHDDVQRHKQQQRGAAVLPVRRPEPPIWILIS